jgi:hypothetical protein
MAVDTQDNSDSCDEEITTIHISSNIGVVADI